MNKLHRILSRFDDSIQGYCDVISKMLDIDVYIVDEEFNTIACSLIYHKSSDKNISHHSGLFREALLQEPSITILYPDTSTACVDCSYKSQCVSLFQLSIPIRINNKELIGMIGLVGVTEKQEKYVSKNKDLVYNLLQQLSELIASKAKLIYDYEMQTEFINQLSFIFDSVDEGIIIYNAENKVLNFNKSALNILEIKNTVIPESTTISLNPTGNTFLNDSEFLLTIDKHTYEVAGTIFDIPIEYKRKLLIFQDINALKLNIMKSVSTNDKINLHNIEGQSKQILDTKKIIQSIACSPSNVLITGESGTGKELVARALHELSDRSEQSFVAINCAAIPDSLLESELFGYVKGAFTGANTQGKIGKFELADKGTLFLDEIGDMPLFIQTKILRVLEEHEVVRVGDNKEIKIDIRIIAATNQNLKKMVENRTFREDLFYRLNVIPIHLPPLRERDGDITALASKFLVEYSGKLKKTILSIEKQFYTELEAYTWPGNIRELRNIIEYVVNLLESPGKVTVDLLGDRLKESNEHSIYNLEYNESKLIRKALENLTTNGYSYESVARELGIGVATLYRKLKKYDISFNSVKYE